MAQIVTAQFVGQTSCGFVSKKYYEIEISAGRSGILSWFAPAGRMATAAVRMLWSCAENGRCRSL